MNPLDWIENEAARLEAADDGQMPVDFVEIAARDAAKRGLILAENVALAVRAVRAREAKAAAEAKAAREAAPVAPVVQATPVAEVTETPLAAACRQIADIRSLAGIHAARECARLGVGTHLDQWVSTGDVASPDGMGIREGGFTKRLWSREYRRAEAAYLAEHSETLRSAEAVVDAAKAEAAKAKAEADAKDKAEATAREAARQADIAARQADIAALAQIRAEAGLLPLWDSEILELIKAGMTPAKYIEECAEAAERDRLIRLLPVLDRRDVRRTTSLDQVRAMVAEAEAKAASKAKAAAAQAKAQAALAAVNARIAARRAGSR